MSVKIVGTSTRDLRVYIDDECGSGHGTEITNVTKIVIEPILPNEPILATISVWVSELNLEVELPPLPPVKNRA